MKQIAQLNKITKRIDKITKQERKITKEIQLLVLNLPDNPNIKRFSDNPHAFIISSSQLFGNIKDNLHSRMDVFYHDFKAQYKYISEVIKKARTGNIVPLLQRIVSEGKYKGDEYKSFNPVVIKHLKNLLEA